MSGQDMALRNDNDFAEKVKSNQKTMGDQIAVNWMLCACDVPPP
jgi:hypothetical protein